MNTNSKRLFAGFCLSWLLLGEVAMRGQADSRGLDSAVQRGLEKSTAFQRAIEAFRSGNIEDGESILASSVDGRAGTGTAHFQLASGLVRSAVLLRDSGQIQASRLLGQRALVQLGIAEQKIAPGNVIAAPIKHMAGIISERIVGSTQGAKAYYRAALALDPKSPANEALSRLEMAETATSARQSATPGRKP